MPPRLASACRDSSGIAIRGRGVVVVPGVPHEPTLLIVEDEVDSAAMLRDLLEKRGYRAHAVTSGKECLEFLQGAAADVIVTDIQMPGITGLELCRELRLRHPDVIVIVLSALANLDNAIGALRNGAYDFITKPVRIDVLDIAVKRALEHLALRREVTRLREGPAIEVEGILGASPAIRATIELTRRAAASDATVLVTGETGTGKELIARALHRGSSRASEPFVAINCGALPAPLLESELFGHAAGAFTDARRAREGLFVRARGGTVFLDEIGEMPLDLQAKLLRVLQERTLRPVGADDEQPFACRIVAATNRDLELEVQGKRFREDLYYRINVVAITVPPLRERGPDILELARSFIARACARSGRPEVALSTPASRTLTEYDWPGNVRELENCIERAVAISRGTTIEVADLPSKIASFEPTRLEITTDIPDDLITLDELHRRYVRRALVVANGNKTHAARILGIDRRSLYRRLHELKRAGTHEDL